MAAMALDKMGFAAQAVTGKTIGPWDDVITPGAKMPGWDAAARQIDRLPHQAKVPGTAERVALEQVDQVFDPAAEYCPDSNRECRAWLAADSAHNGPVPAARRIAPAGARQSWPTVGRH